MRVEGSVLSRLKNFLSTVFYWFKEHIGRPRGIDVIVVLMGLRDRHGNPVVKEYEGRLVDLNAWPEVAADIVRSIAASMGVYATVGYAGGIRYPAMERRISVIKNTLLRLVALLSLEGQALLERSLRIEISSVVHGMDAARYKEWFVRVLNFIKRLCNEFNQEALYITIYPSHGKVFNLAWCPCEVLQKLPAEIDVFLKKLYKDYLDILKERKGSEKNGMIIEKGGKRVLARSLDERIMDIRSRLAYLHFVSATYAPAFVFSLGWMDAKFPREAELLSDEEWDAAVGGEVGRVFADIKRRIKSMNLEWVKDIRLVNDIDVHVVVREDFAEAVEALDEKADKLLFGAAMTLRERIRHAKTLEELEAIVSYLERVLDEAERVRDVVKAGGEELRRKFESPLFWRRVRREMV